MADAWVRGVRKHAASTGLYAVPIETATQAGCCGKYNPLLSGSGGYDQLWGVDRPPPPLFSEGDKNTMAAAAFGLIPGMNTLMAFRDPTAGPWRKAFAVAIDAASFATFGMASLASGGIKGASGAGRVLALDTMAFRNLRALKMSGVVSSTDALVVAPNVQAELARHGILATDLASAGVSIAAESSVGVSIPASKLAQILRGLGGPGAKSAAADALNVVEAADIGADAFVTADAQVLRAFQGGVVVPGSDGLFINVIGF